MATIDMFIQSIEESELVAAWSVGGGAMVKVVLAVMDERFKQLVPL